MSRLLVAALLMSACQDPSDTAAECGPVVTVVSEGSVAVEVGAMWQAQSCYIAGDGAERCSDVTAELGPVNDGAVTVGAVEWDGGGDSWYVIATW